MIDAKDKLKGIYAITPPKFDETKLLNDINICLSCGVKIFQIRYKEEITIELKDFFSVLVKRIKEKEGITIINDFPQLAYDIGADGVHLGKADLSVDAVKNKYKNLVIVSFSGHANIDNAIESVKAGANDFIEKPFETKKLIHIIQKNLLELKQRVTINNYRNKISFHSKIDSIGNGGPEGGMTNFLLVKNAILNESIFKLPDEMSFEIGALVEPFAVALRTINRSNLDQDSKIAVCGLGCIGFSVVTLLSYFGYKNIIAIDLYNLRVFNANEVGSVKAYSNWESFTDALKEFHGEEEIFGIPVSNTDVFIDCTGNHKLISDIINLSKKHARIVITGLHQDQALVDFRSVLMRELEITCSMAYSNKEFLESLKILSARIAF